MNNAGCFRHKGVCFIPLARDWFKNGHEHQSGMAHSGLTEKSVKELSYKCVGKFKKSNKGWHSILGLVTSNRKDVTILKGQRREMV